MKTKEKGEKININKHSALCMIVMILYALTVLLAIKFLIPIIYTIPHLIGLSIGISLLAEPIVVILFLSKC